MTDEQIEMALECCAIWGKCKDCPYYNVTYKNKKDNCAFRSTVDALALIKRQREEIAKLEAENAEQDQAIINALRYIKVVREEARAEAIQEFEKAVMELFPSDKIFTTISCASIMQIARKMTEEQK